VELKTEGYLKAVLDSKVRFKQLGQYVNDRAEASHHFLQLT